MLLGGGRDVRPTHVRRRAGAKRRIERTERAAATAFGGGAPSKELAGRDHDEISTEGEDAALGHVEAVRGAALIGAVQVDGLRPAKHELTTHIGHAGALGRRATALGEH